MIVTANVTRDGDWWAVEVPDFKGGFHTQAARLDEVPDMVRDAVSMFGIEPGDVEVAVAHRLDEPLARMVDTAKSSRRAAAEAAAAAAARTRAAAKSLTGAGLAVRDTAALLGVSQQRVRQLLAA
ncbi:MAG: XRE family transcriptional regulator [Bifidobacteriaceae bacterium]|jgi:hypothetical protein|nr:XRE family transcriptional regulator [Bifidobacteriaceae bacterium]